MEDHPHPLPTSLKGDEQYVRENRKMAQHHEKGYSSKRVWEGQGWARLK